jgi:hypothetical protein
MARYRSEQIGGHGIPEAIESILISGSRVRQRLAVLKPLSAAIPIGTGLNLCNLWVTLLEDRIVQVHRTEEFAK